MDPDRSEPCSGRSTTPPSTSSSSASAAIALAPTWLALVGGFLAIRCEWDGLFVLSLTAPYVVAALGVFAILAID